jgi:hypothetical protein
MTSLKSYDPIRKKISLRELVDVAVSQTDKHSKKKIRKALGIERSKKTIY